MIEKAEGTIHLLSLYTSQYLKEGRRVFCTSSFQTQSVPLLHILGNHFPDIKILFIDTGYLFAETYTFKKELEKKFNLQVITLSSTTSLLHQKDVNSGLLQYAINPDYCCHINKVVPLNKFLKSGDIWISGVRRDQTSIRSNMDVIEEGENGIIKFHPMLDWTKRDVYKYIQENNLPKHPLEEQGYVSIGCVPCTYKWSEGKKEEDGGLAAKKQNAVFIQQNNNMNVLITGGAGYIGTSLVNSLNTHPDVKKIYVLDNLSRNPLAFFLGKEKLLKISFIKADILDVYALEQIIKQVDVIYHMAGYVLSPYNYSQNVQYEQINQWGTLNLVRTIQQTEHNIQQIVYLSSASVYGLRGEVDMEKDLTYHAYGKSKLAAEKYLGLLSNELSVNIIRSANVFGYNGNFRMDSVLNNFFFQSIVHKKILIYGDGTQTRPFVYLPNLIGKLVNLINQKAIAEIRNEIDFNASLNDIKNWILANQIKDLEYTYINRELDYEGQKLKGYDLVDGKTDMLSLAYNEFKNNLRVSSI